MCESKRTLSDGPGLATVAGPRGRPELLQRALHGLGRDRPGVLHRGFGGRLRAARLDARGVTDRGHRLSTTSLAVVYAVLVEDGLSETPLGKLLMSATGPSAGLPPHVSYRGRKMPSVEGRDLRRVSSSMSSLGQGRPVRRALTGRGGPRRGRELAYLPEVVQRAGVGSESGGARPSTRRRSARQSLWQATGPLPKGEASARRCAWTGAPGEGAPNKPAEQGYAAPLPRWIPDLSASTSASPAAAAHVMWRPALVIYRCM